MSHPDPMFDPDNCHEDDEMFIEQDEDNSNYHPDADHEVDSQFDEEDDWDDSIDDSMDGDAESAFGSCGWGMDEYYNHDCDYGEDY